MPAKQTGDVLDVIYNHSDMVKLLFRFAINMTFITLLVRYVYYRKTANKDFLFTYYSISVIAFMICFALKKLEIHVGMGLGLFAIFGIIRYRTDTVRIREMSYLFVVIGLSVVNALAGKQISLVELLFINVTVTGVIAGLEYLWLMKQETIKTIIYEKIENIKPENYHLLKADLENRTGLKITRIEVGKIDFLRDTAQIKIHFLPNEQKQVISSDFSEMD